MTEHWQKLYSGLLTRGDKIRLKGSSIEFTLEDSPANSHDMCTQARTYNNQVHYLFLGTGEVQDGVCAGLGIDVLKKTPNYLTGFPYRDQAGEFFLRGYFDGEDGWYSQTGKFFPDGDDYVSLPMEGPLS